MIDVDEEDECFYLVMEYIEGPTLAEYIHNHGPLSVETAIKFTEQILSGIKHAHDMRIVHRDIKPQNILIDKNKTLKIFDFGIAKALSETSLTQTNHVLGTVQYLRLNKRKVSLQTKVQISILLVLCYMKCLWASLLSMEKLL